MTEKGKNLSYREKRMEDSAKKFLNGKARRPYILRKDIAIGLKRSLNEDTVDDLSSESFCTCKENLGKFSEKFKNLLHPSKASDQTKSKNFKQQNKWLLENIFDSHGNYLYCFACIKKILGVGGDRLNRLREIKRQQVNMPIIRIPKDQVPAERIGDIILPENETNLLSWWVKLEDNCIVELRSPPKLHRGKSNNSKEHILPRFLDFIDINSQPNGRRVGSHGPLFYLNSKFDRINTPSKNEADKPEQWKRRSLVYEFNRSIQDKNMSISNGTAKKWMKKYRPKHAISPKKTDYCEMCVECQEQKKRHETISIRLQQSGNANEDEIKENQALAESYRLLLEEHKMDAGNEIQHYREQTNKSQASYREVEQYQKKKHKIHKTRLQKLKEQITFSLTLDYQQSKLTPHWGFSAQPSETYYLRKLSHNIFGIVNHAFSSNTVYVIDERVGGPKNGDITISLVNNYINQALPSWARHLCLFMDNGATNKNQFMIQWAMELVKKMIMIAYVCVFLCPAMEKMMLIAFFQEYRTRLRKMMCLQQRNLLLL